MADRPTTHEEFRIRAAIASDGPAIDRLASRTFSAADDADGTESEVEAGPPGRPEPPPPLTVVAEQDGRIMAAASARLRGQWFGGQRMLCAAVGGVAVAVEARASGLGRSVMTALLTTAKESGAVTSALIPSTHRFYASLGYGVAGRRPVYAVATPELRALASQRPEGLRLRRTVPTDAAAVGSLVRSRAVSGSGLLDHSGVDEGLVDDPTGPDSYVVEVAGRVVGWCLLQRRAPTVRLANYDLVVNDLVADDPDVELVLWRLLGGDFPSALRAETLIPAGCVLERHLERQQDVVENASWMLSLLDVPVALRRRGYPTGAAADLVLGVDDTTFAGNAGPWRLTVSGGRGAVELAQGATPDAVVRASDLAGMFTAHLDPVQAHRQGRLGPAAPEVAATLRTVWAGPPAWLARAF